MLFLVCNYNKKYCTLAYRAATPYILLYQQNILVVYRKCSIIWCLCSHVDSKCCLANEMYFVYMFVCMYCCAELAEVVHRRVVIIHGLTMQEFAHQRLLDIMSRSSEFRVNFVFKDNIYGEAVAVQNKVEALWEGWELELQLIFICTKWVVPIYVVNLFDVVCEPLGSVSIHFEVLLHDHSHDNAKSIHFT